MTLPICPSLPQSIQSSPRRTLAAAAAAALTLLLTAGCSHRTYYAYAPPPPPVYAPPAYAQVPPLVQVAERQGFAAGEADGSRDAYNRVGYRPQHDRDFRNPPGYDPSLGPHEPYREYFRRAYLRGYDRAFGRS